jgi:hypothetical protein
MVYIRGSGLYEQPQRCGQIALLRWNAILCEMLNKLNLMFIGACIIVIVEEWKTNLMSLAVLFDFLCAQPVSDFNPLAPELFF